MRAPGWSVEQLRSEIAVLGARGLSRREYFAELAPRLRRVVDNDATCWHTLDPQTHLMTSDEPAELVERGVFTNESASPRRLGERRDRDAARAPAPSARPTSRRSSGSPARSPWASAARSASKPPGAGRAARRPG
jgi:hypothetical protein